MNSLREVECALDVYTLEEILELNDLPVVDALYLLVEEGHVKLPNPNIVNLDD